MLGVKSYRGWAPWSPISSGYGFMLMLFYALQYLRVDFFHFKVVKCFFFLLLAPRRRQQSKIPAKNINLTLFISVFNFLIALI